MKHKPPFSEVYETHYEDVWRFLLHATADVPAALDLTASTFYLALRAWPSFQPTNVPVKAWLIRIAINEWRRELRRRKISRFIPMSSLSNEIRESLTVDDGEVLGACEAMERAETFLALRQAIRRLPRKYETVILLYYFEDQNLEQVAAVLGRPVGTVKSLIHRAIVKLRQDQGLRNTYQIQIDEGHLTLESSS
jgi:RNA polymerase sigma-70 factor (ECF subfamily)